LHRLPRFDAGHNTVNKRTSLPRTNSRAQSIPSLRNSIWKEKYSD
jgi:hypothetical protein